LTVLCETVDPDGRPVVLIRAGWDHIVRRHPEMAGRQSDVMRAVSEPQHREPDRRPGRERFWRSGEGPSRWLLVVVDFDPQPARVVTAFGNRADPPGWTA
jgi:hypothetical protein